MPQGHIPQDQCANGHPFVEGSFRIRTERGSVRQCLECEAEQQARYYRSLTPEKLQARKDLRRARRAAAKADLASRS